MAGLMYLFHISQCLHISIRDSVCPRPFLDVVEVTTNVLALVVRPVATHTLLTRLTCWMEGENIHITQAHQIDS